ncbi:hypothetical protein C8Q70DRAFT_1035722 [Cubamyces menziesii]|nr:hypothetical protein C8Q70DRAFT_1035722 [Cubamyces menziesii]
MQLAWTQMFSVPVPPEGFPSTIFNHVHVVDVAEMHMRVLNTEDAGGKRFLASAGVCSFQDWYDIASGLSGDPLPGLVKLHPPREGRLGEALPAHTIYSGRRAEDELGIIYKPLSETVGDVMKDFSGRGWLQHLEN